MKVLIDTPIWSLAFRRKKSLKTIEDEKTLQELKELISETRAILIGPIRQEVLSGISSPRQFNLLKKKLRAFENNPITSSDYEIATEYYNKCRTKGIQGSHIDFLICAVAQRNGMAIFTNDKDFQHFSKILELSLHRPRDFEVSNDNKNA